MWPLAYRVVHSVCRTVIPVPEHRIPIRLHHVPRLLLPLVPFFWMAYLSRRPGTFYQRLLLLPLVICLALGTYFGFMYTAPELNIYNWGQGLFAEVICAKAIDFAWRRDGMLKVGEAQPRVLARSPCVPNGAGATSDDSVPRRSLPPWLYDALEVALTSRGLGWQFGAGVYVPKDPRPLERSAFLRAAAMSTLRQFIVFDLVESLIKRVPGVGSPHGGTMFRPNLAIPERYMLSTALHLATGTCLIAGFEMVHGLITLFALVALSSPPEMWPPLMDNPWISDSLHVFWAKRWHQVLRQTFFVYGGYAGRWLGGDVGMLVGTFFASGMFHECAAHLLGQGFSWSVVAYFTLQAVLLLLEKLWRRATGKRVGGTYGMLWVHLCIFVMAQPLVDSWHRRGLGGGAMIPRGISPARRLLFPFLRRVEERVGFGPLSAMETFLEGASLGTRAATANPPDGLGMEA